MPTTVNGRTAEGFDQVRETLQRLVAANPDWNAAYCAYSNGRLVVDLWTGEEMAHDTIVPVYSSTKGMAAICVALLVQRGELDPQAPVAEYWPQFAAAGKQAISVGQLLSHQAGLPTVDGGFTVTELCDGRLANRLASQRPYWRPGFAHGYHSLTIGPLVDELFHRASGRKLSEFFSTEVAGPASADVHLGLPESASSRMLPSLHPESAPETAEIAGGPFQDVALDMVDLDPPVDLVRLANHPLVIASGPSSIGGTASARGLAKVYAACISPIRRPALLEPATIVRVGQPLARGMDVVLGVQNSFALLFAKSDPRLPWGARMHSGTEAMGAPWASLTRTPASQSATSRNAPRSAEVPTRACFR